MQSFAYTAKNAQGQTVRGRIDASDQKDALKRIRQLGLWPMRLDKAAGPVREVGLGTFLSENLIQPLYTGVSLKDKAIFFRQLGTMLAAGMGIASALAEIHSHTRNRRLRGIVERAHVLVTNGQPLSRALSEHPRIFGLDQVQMVAAGELGGRLESCLANIADTLEKEIELREEIRSATFLPKIMIGMVILAYGFASSTNSIAAVILGRGSASAAVWSVVSGLLWVLAIVAAAWVAGRFLLLVPALRYAYDAVKVNFPIAAGLVRKYAAARFARLLAALYRSGVAPNAAVSAAAESIGNRVIRSSLLSAAPAIQAGQPMSLAFAQSKFLPDMVVSMIRTGEQSGNMDFSLDKAAEYLELEAASTTKRLPRILFVVVLLAYLTIGVILVLRAYRTYAGNMQQMLDELQGP
jgi:type II secretory pathway component PulF